jgi:hypothetical protein
MQLRQSLQTLGASSAENRGMWIAVTLVVILIGANATTAVAEPAITGLSRETVGGTVGIDDNPSQTFQSDFAPSRHMDATNKPCLRVSPLFKKQGLNPNLYDQILLLDNQCSQAIKIRACYYKSSSCTVMRIGAYQRQQQNLGVSTTPDFRYSFREYLDQQPFLR